jgi:hypothetical protein
MTLRFRWLAEIVENPPPEGWRSKNAPPLRGLANLRVNGQAGTRTMHYFSISSGAADCVGRESII